MKNNTFPTTFPYTVFGESLQVIGDVTVEVYDPQEQTVYKDNLYNLMVDSTLTVLFFYPNDFSYVCPTELEQLNRQYTTFKENDCDVLVISRDSVYAHKKWIEIEPRLKELSIKMISDKDGQLLKPLNLFEEGEPFKRITLITGNRGEIITQEILPTNVGRNIDELLRQVKAINHVIENPNTMCPENRDSHNDDIKIDENSGDELFS